MKCRRATSSVTEPTASTRWSSRPRLPPTRAPTTASTAVSPAVYPVPKAAWTPTGNGTLDAGEVTQTGYVCNGFTGATGQNEFERIQRPQLADPSVRRQHRVRRSRRRGDRKRRRCQQQRRPRPVRKCSTPRTLCNGATSLVRPLAISPGAICSQGGVDYKSGVDSNGDGVLEDSEVTHDAYICNGEAGDLLSVVSVDAGNAVCADGGTQVNVGPDTNGNGTLDDSEITSTTYICAP